MDNRTLILLFTCFIPLFTAVVGTIIEAISLQDSAQAPALIGTWMGARIIASYMKKHKDMKLKDLLEFTDYHVMLSESNYLAS